MTTLCMGHFSICTGLRVLPPPECASGRTHSSRVGCPHIALRRTEILKRNNYYYLLVHVLLTLSSCSVAFFV